MSRSGLAKRASTSEAWAERGVRARFFSGRLERGSADVESESGVDCDIAVMEQSRYHGTWIRRGCARVVAHVMDTGVNAM